MTFSASSLVPPSATGATQQNFSTQTSQGPFYADVQILVDEAGLVSVRGDTNNPLLESIHSSPLYTSKEGAHWLLNISTNQVFENAIFEVHLPKGSSITYMKIPSFSRFEDTNDGLVLIGTAENQKLNLLVQYSLKSSSNNLPPWWFYALVAFVLSSAVMFLKKRFSPSYEVKEGLSFPHPRSRKGKKVFSNRTHLSHASHSANGSSFSSSPQSSSSLRLDAVFDQLPERQKMIITLIRESPSGFVTQAKLEKETGFPKSSLSRNVDSLVRKGFIQKEQTGMTNTLSLKLNED